MSPIKPTTAAGASLTTMLTLFLVSFTIQTACGFTTTTPFIGRQQQYSDGVASIPAFTQSSSIKTTTTSTSTTRLYMSFDSNDPFEILGLNGMTIDKKEIKRAYKKMALKYHPDMTTNRDSTAEEKRAASDRFAKINWAYETLMAGNKGSTSTQSSSSSSSSAKDEWVPPHRRKAGSYGSSSSSRSSSSSSRSRDSDPFGDYIPKYDDYDKAYDSGGDSFEKIFSDLFTGAVGAAASSGIGKGSGIFTDFVEFLERSNIDGSGGIGGVGGTSGSDDADLRFLLQTGTVQEVGDEMDETDLVVQQLTSKLRNMDNDLITLRAEVAVASRYAKKMELEQEIDELEARKKVVEGYLAKARKRLTKLQSRYKELIVRGGDDRRARGKDPSTSTASWEDIKRESYSSPGSRTSSRASSSTSTGSRSTDRASSTSGTSSSSAGSGTGASSNKEDAWKDESFGSFGRSRGSSRRRSSRQRPQETSSTASTSSYGSERRSYSSTDSSQQSSSNYSSSRSESRPSSSSYDPKVPPHRRVTDSYQEYNRREEDKKRLREIKVDEEFEKLKKELGL